MKKNRFLYYFLIVSLVVHLLAAYLFRFIPWDVIKEQASLGKEPIFVDVLGPLKHGKQTKVPKAPDDKEQERDRPVASDPEKAPDKPRQMLARAVPVHPVPVPMPARPSMPAMPPAQPVPAPSTPQPVQPSAPQPPARGGGGEGLMHLPGPDAGTPSTPSQAVPPSGTPGRAGKPGQPGQAAEPPRRLVQPTVEDLMRYAKVDPNVQKAEPDQGITLDTEDLMYTSYMQGLKNRIELIWKYPETARRDGLQGELVMKFSIAKSGRVQNIEMIKSSGYEMLDRAAKKALEDASPFNPLPDSWKKEEFVITGTFVYKLYGMYVR